MGNTQSPPIDPRFASASRAFTPGELQELKSKFDSLIIDSNSDGDSITLEVFQDHFVVKGSLGIRLYDLITEERKDGRLTFEDLVIFKSVYEKGTSQEIDEIIYRLVDVNGDGVVDRSDTESVVVAIVETVFSSPNKSIVTSILKASVLNEEDRKSSSQAMTLDDFRSWVSFVPSLRRALGSLLLPSSGARPGFLVPELKHQNENLLTTKEFAWHIGGALSTFDQGEWVLLYHSSTSGLSFNTFFTRISSFGGPTVLVVKDKEGYLYGGYASHLWERRAEFYGDMKSFLFQLHPKAAVFKATGINKSFQWCGVNFSSESIPNGIGFGGRANNFGLFLCGSLDQGHTYSCTTYGSPCLSKSHAIVPEVIECWGTGTCGLELGEDHVKGTVLERFKEDRHLLNMVGLATDSVS